MANFTDEEYDCMILTFNNIRNDPNNTPFIINMAENIYNKLTVMKYIKTEAYHIQCLIDKTEHDNLKESGMFTETEIVDIVKSLNTFNKQVAEQI